MSAPVVVSVAPGSAAERAGLCAGDEVVSINGIVPRDIIEWQFAADEGDIELELNRGGLQASIEITKRPGEPLGAEVSSAVFDRVRTCDNHCEFCFIYQLPSGMRRSLYLKDDDYRLSFLYGNFTTLTRFTEADLERVVTERLSPLYVSIHATDPDVRAAMLRNRRGATSLRWLRALLDHDIEVHGQIVVCPGINDGDVLADTLAGVLDRYDRLASLAVVPLGVGRYSSETSMRPHTTIEAQRVVDVVEQWQQVFLRVLDRRLVFAADEYYLLAGRAFPAADEYEGFPMTEDGIGLARSFELALHGDAAAARGTHAGFFASVDGAPAEGYRANRTSGRLRLGVSGQGRVAVLTGEYGARVLEPALAGAGFAHARVVRVRNEYFGGNIAVTGLLTGPDLARTLATQPVGDRYLLPDVCLTNGVFLDGSSPADLPRPVEIVPADGLSLRRAILGQPVGVGL